MKQKDMFDFLTGRDFEAWRQQVIKVRAHDRAVPYQKKSATSRRSAEEHREKFPTQRAKVYEFVVSRGPTGATNNEIAQMCNMRLSSVCSATNTLRRDGYLADSGETRKDLLTERYCAVWVAS